MTQEQQELWSGGGWPMAGRPSFCLHVEANGKGGLHQLLPKVMPYLKEYAPWRHHARLEGIDKQVTASVLVLLDHVSGGNVAEFLSDVFRGKKDVLWRACLGGAEESVGWNADERSGVLRAMKLSGWTTQEVSDAGFESPTKREWTKVATPDSKAAGRAANESLHERIMAEWRSASVDSCIVLKRLSRERGEDVTIRHVQTTFSDVYANSVLNKRHSSATPGLTVSKTQFMRFRPPEIRRAKRRTDMCEYCLLAATKIAAIRRIYYERGKYSVLGVSLVWSYDGRIQKSFLDVLLPTINQDACCVILVWKVIIAFVKRHIKCTCCKSKELSLWADSGRHLMCKLTISFLLQQPRVRTLNFFCAKHGKSLCDSHFGRCSAALESCPTDILSLNRVCELFETIPNTTAQVVFLRSQTLSPITVYDIQKVHCIHSYSRNGNEIRISPTANGVSHKVQWTSSSVSPQFEGKASDKLPGISALKGKVVFVHDEGRTREEQRETVSEGALRRHQERYQTFLARRNRCKEQGCNANPQIRRSWTAKVQHMPGHDAPCCPQRGDVDEESESDENCADDSGEEEPQTPKRARRS